MSRSASSTVSGLTAERENRNPPFGAPHVFVLAVVDGNDPASVHRLTQATTVVGRGDQAGYVIDDTEVSKLHCEIRVDGPVCTLKDLGSLNGTFLNGRRMRDGVAQRIRHLDQIRIGGTRLFLLSGRFRP